MLKNLIQLTLLSVVWKRYRSMILSTLLLLGYFYLVALVHEDYLSYSALNDNQQYLGFSFILKWLAFIIGLAVYLLYNFGFLLRKRPNAGHPATPTQSASTPEPSSQAGKTDPFERIRRRDKLRSRADFIIEHNRKQHD